MKNLMNILMLSCKKSSELIEKKMYFRLTLIERIQLAMHISMCDACKNWKKQSKHLDKMLHKHINEQVKENDDIRLADEKKQEIILKLKSNK